jgi:hypothetical protein
MKIIEFGVEVISRIFLLVISREFDPVAMTTFRVSGILLLTSIWRLSKNLAGPLIFRYWAFGVANEDHWGVLDEG